MGMVDHPYLEALKLKINKDGLAMANVPLLRKILDAPSAVDDALALLVCAHVFVNTKSVYYAFKGDTLILSNTPSPTNQMRRREGAGLADFTGTRRL